MRIFTRTGTNRHLASTDGSGPWYPLVLTNPQTRRARSGLCAIKVLVCRELVAACSSSYDGEQRAVALKTAQRHTMYALSCAKTRSSRHQNGYLNMTSLGFRTRVTLYLGEVCATQDSSSSVRHHRRLDAS